ncbi:VirD4-like conjugal transfer protein, CD1115 family [Acidipropionibacterium jensenii]|nr:type IV secretory system conjugative DNA transfer family protein [Acidipropionibacterium jensenii]MDN6480026.1 type IV secretory system conjugative DNA transfer family protein [Acidipropionibacterium jensenii]MDN6513625.1 type IV secretory system conjugative DNA transfer family protein [Acidipropionibacterium jensenii]MDN6593092.1 type IV secretory system conjugative DNA transfer family protein [Acidipropionibacterium jensenii]MDN6761466.1 type IV secretory system conjugative DNA transfer fa
MALAQKRLKNVGIGVGVAAVVVAGLAAVRISWQVRTWTAAHGLDTVLDHLLDDLKANPWRWRAGPIDWAVGAAMVFVLALIWLYRASIAWDRRTGEEYGSAKWGRPADLAGLANPDDAQNILLTRHIKLSTDAVSARPENQRNTNILCVGGSGLGKTRNFIEPNLAHGCASMVVTDPKGEIYKATAAGLAERGYRIRQLNLIDLEHSHGFNPLAYLRAGHEAEDIEELAKGIIANTEGAKPKGGGLDPFWERAELALMTAIIAYVVACYPPNRRNLPEVAALLDKVSTADHQQSDGGTDAMFRDADEGRIPSDNPDLLIYAQRRYGVFKMAHPKTASSILVSAAVRLSLLSIPAVENVMSYDELVLDRMGDDRTAVFVTLPDTTDAYAFITSLFFQVLFVTLFRVADARPDGRLAIPVQCWMDEFPNLGVIPLFHQRVATMRSRGISAQIFLQNNGQLDPLYGDKHAETIRGNCDTTLFLGTSDRATAEEVSKRLGKATIVSVDSGEQRGGRGGSSRSRRALGRELMTPDEVYKMDRRTALVMISGKRPVQDQKLPAPAAAPATHEEVSA